MLAYLDGALDAEAFAQLSQVMRDDLDTLTHDEQAQAMQKVNLEQADATLSFKAQVALLARGSEHAELVHLHGELKPAQCLTPYLIGGAIAAVLVLAVTLTFVFSGGGNFNTNYSVLEDGWVWLTEAD